MQDILLLSDGDDPAGDGEWRKGARFARARDIPVHTVGVGTPDRPSAIPVEGGESYRHDGKAVFTRLEEGPLQEIARLTEGGYVPAHTRDYPLGELFLEQIATGSVREHSDDALPVYHQHYEGFLAGAFGLLALALALGDGSRRRPPRSIPPS